jgi:hypothetical protein
MKKNLLTILFCLGAVLCHSQNVSLNYGGASQTNYFTALKYENVSGKFIIKVTLGEKEYRFLLDTGGPNLISRKLFDS